FILNDAEDRVVAVDASLLPLLEQLMPKLPYVRHVLVVGEKPAGLDTLDGRPVHAYEDVVAAGAEDTAFPRLDEQHAAAMCYTSGTTGNPKGVVYSHRSMLLHTFSTMLVDSLAITERDTILPIVPMFHANAWGFAQSAVM